MSVLGLEVSEYYHFSSVRSTQDLARTLARQGSPGWTLVVADRQTAGRGRMGRKWSSPEGGLYFSLVLKPKVPPEGLATLNLRCADALSKALTRATGLWTRVVAPNDILASPNRRGPFRKVCGLLADACGTDGRTEWLVLGVGINVNNRIPPALARSKAASLLRLTGRRWDRRRILEEALRALKGTLALN